MTRLHLAVITLAFAPFAFAAPATAAVTPISGLTQWQSNASVDNNAANAGPTGSMDWTSLPVGQIFGQSAAVAVSTASSATSSTAGSSAAAWNSASDGNAQFNWWHSFAGQGAKGAFSNAVLPNWEYRFSVDTPTIMTIDYFGFTTLVSGDSAFGLNNMRVDWNDGSATEALSDFGFWPQGSGTYTRLLAPGMHRVTVSNNHWLSTSSALHVEGSVNMTWSLAETTGAVPEPQSWAMLIVGFGIVGGAMRGRRSAAQPRHVTA